MAALITKTTAEGVTTYSINPVEDNILLKPINGVTQMIAGEPLSAGEAFGTSLVIGVTAWAFGYKKGYDDRMSGSARKTLGIF